MADGVLILGGTEPHYTPSKVYQAILSKKPIIAILHKLSFALALLKKSSSAKVLDFNGSDDLQSINNNWANTWIEFESNLKCFDPELIDQRVFEMYSARHVTQKLVSLLDEIII